VLGSVRLARWTWKLRALGVCAVTAANVRTFLSGAVTA
jgi:hypothetical protein